MNDVLGPLESHEIQYLLQLLEIQVLLRSDDVDVLIEIVFFLTINGGSQVAGAVQRRSVGLGDQRRRHAVGLQIYDLRAPGFLKQSLVLQHLDDAGHLIGIEALAVDDVILDVQHLINAVELSHGLVLEPLPEPDFFRLALFQISECLPGLVLQLRVLLRLNVELGIIAEQRCDLVGLYILLISPLAVSYDHLAELCAVVARVVPAAYIVSQCLIDQIDGIADDRAPDVTDVERLGDIGRGVLHDNQLAFTYIRLAEIVRVQRLFQCGCGIFLLGKEHVDIGLDRLNLLKKAVSADGFRYICRDQVRRFAKDLGKFKTGKRIVSHGLVLGDLHEPFNFFCRQVADMLRDDIRDFLFIIDHSSNSFSVMICSTPCSFSTLVKHPSPGIF